MTSSVAGGRSDASRPDTAGRNGPTSSRVGWTRSMAARGPGTGWTNAHVAIDASPSVSWHSEKRNWCLPAAGPVREAGRPGDRPRTDRTLATGESVRRGENLVMVGQSGVGKRHLPGAVQASSVSRDTAFSTHQCFSRRLPRLAERGASAVGVLIRVRSLQSAQTVIHDWDHKDHDSQT